MVRSPRRATLVPRAGPPGGAGRSCARPAAGCAPRCDLGTVRAPNISGANELAGSQVGSQQRQPQGDVRPHRATNAAGLWCTGRRPAPVWPARGQGFESPKLHVSAVQKYISILKMIFDFLHCQSCRWPLTSGSGIGVLARQSTPANPGRPRSPRTPGARPRPRRAGRQDEQLAGLGGALAARYRRVYERDNGPQLTESAADLGRCRKADRAHLRPHRAVSQRLCDAASEDYRVNHVGGWRHRDHDVRILDRLRRRRCHQRSPNGHSVAMAGRGSVRDRSSGRWRLCQGI
jgi:hypothetical protein